MKLTRSRKRTMHGVGLSHAKPGGGPCLKEAPWWKDINGMWCTTSKHVYFFSFRRSPFWIPAYKPWRKEDRKN